MFAYYIPQSVVESKIKKPTPIGLTTADMQILGIGHLDKVAARNVTAGPDGQLGWLLYRDVPGEINSFDAVNQTWQRMPLPNDVWIGYETSKGMPQPRTLQRPEIIPGSSAVLGDGNAWAIPAAYEWDESLVANCPLPRSLAVQYDGSWTLGNVVPEHRRLWDLVSEYLDAQSSAIDGRFQFPKINDWCVLALQTNYYVGPYEVSLMMLLNQTTRNAVIDAILDLATYRNILKKKQPAPDTGDTSDGLSASTLANQATIDRPTPIGSITI